MSIVDKTLKVLNASLEEATAALGDLQLQVAAKEQTIKSLREEGGDLLGWRIKYLQLQVKHRRMLAAASIMVAFGACVVVV